MAISTTNQNLALQFFMFRFCKKLNPFPEDFASVFIDFCFTHYNEIPTSKRINSIETLYNGKVHFNLGLEIQSLNTEFASIGDIYPITLSKD